ncbi:MAG: mannose-1-phosphate guanylyltransferase/mannose-6-phosphate isomerase [Betaproteobacteria bacterium]|nr:mannose-1-phosphate guanylyltransferase/mannose-6-phosphate isomerase [Betaproteobacteria bacterium]
MNIQPVILCGGSGTRLWPLSRDQYPKQLLSLTGQQTMLQATASRLDGATLPAGSSVLPPILVSNEDYRFITAEQLRQNGQRSAAIVLEPVGRNTAPALTLAALSATSAGGDPVLLVMPADHVIRDTSAFCAAAFDGARLAEEGRFVTFGITPSAPETGYGYIRCGKPLDGQGRDVFEIASFVEKPDLPTAKRYLASGEYFWNSGIFMMKASRWIEEIHRFRPDIADSCGSAIATCRRDSDFLRVDKAAFESCPSDSIDYAVMEKVDSAVVIPVDAGWSDVGAWDALWQIGDKDDGGNVTKGDVLLHDTRDTLAISESRLVACVGLRDVVVVETPDAVMVAHKDRTQDVRQIVNRLKREGRAESAAHRKIHRPWGYYDSIDNGERFQVKRIVVKPGATLSLQMHHHRAEHWVVVRGTARVTRGDEVFLLGENQSTYIPLGVRHRLENPGKLPLEIVEVQSGAYLGEDDIVRFADTYGRD